MSKYIKEELEGLLRKHKEHEAQLTEIDLKLEEYKERLEYAGTVYYDRLILGQWKNAEGIIYRQFADNPSLYIKDEAVDEYGQKISFMIISIGIDYGATEGETEFKDGFERYNVDEKRQE